MEFNWAGKSSGNNAGDISFKSHGSVHAAEQVLGIEIGGLEDSTGSEPWAPTTSSSEVGPRP